jgi:dihydroorotate dehydrogenase
MNLYPFARPLLFCFDAETAHHISLNTIDQARRFGLLPGIIGKVPECPTKFCGFDLPNPVGLAAGLDKDGKHIDALASLGFGFLEIGTVTPLAQPGNPLPRMFRIPEENAIINRMGFNNDGVDACVTRVKASQFYQSGGVIGLNIGKNAITPIEQASKDYITCLQKVYEVASYVTVNISSPNTKNLRQLQGGQDLVDLLRALTSEREKLSQTYGKRVPLFLKIAPDLEHEQIESVADALLEFKIDALIATNTTLSRTGVENLKHASEAGGLSGKPVKQLATMTIKSFADLLHGKIPIIGVGGIMTGVDALEKHHAGASVVQLYSGLIYKGPQLIKDSIVAFQST